MDCSPPGSSIHGIFQARVLEWVASAFSKYQTLGMFKNITFYSCEETFPTIKMFPTILLRNEKPKSEFFPFLDE